MLKNILTFFDKLEDKVRFRLSHHPVIYAVISGIGATLFFRGIWLIADQYTFMTGWVTFIISLVILLLTGALVGQFLNDRIIISGITKDKKLAEKTEKEIREEIDALSNIQKELREINQKISSLSKK